MITIPKTVFVKQEVWLLSAAELSSFLLLCVPGLPGTKIDALIQRLVGRSQEFFSFFFQTSSSLSKCRFVV